MTKRDKTNMLLGALGYTNLNYYDKTYNVAYNLLKDNSFDIEKIINLNLELNSTLETETSKISLVGSYARVKIKKSEFEDIISLIYSYDVEIEVD